MLTEQRKKIMVVSQPSKTKNLATMRVTRTVFRTFCASCTVCSTTCIFILAKRLATKKAHEWNNSERTDYSTATVFNGMLSSPTYRHQSHLHTTKSLQSTQSVAKQRWLSKVPTLLRHSTRTEPLEPSWRCSAGSTPTALAAVARRPTTFSQHKNTPQ